MTRALNVGVIVADPGLRHSLVDCLNQLKVRIAFAVSPVGADVSALEHSNPDVLVVDFGHASAYPIMTELRSLPTPPPVIGAHTSADPDVILAAVRWGAREFLYPPFSAETVEKALDTIASQLLLKAPRHRAGKTIGFLSSAGGCGATTVACHVAAELRRLTSTEILVADFDLAAGMAGFWLRANGAHSIVDVAGNLQRMDLSLWKGMVHAVQPHLDVIGAPAEIPLDGLPGTASFNTALRYARSNYDWVVADLGQGLSPLSLALIPELDTLYIVTTPEVAPLFQARRIIRRLMAGEHTKESPRLIFNRTRKEFSQESRDREKLFATPVDAHLPEDYGAVSEAHVEGRLVSPKSDLGKRLAQLAAKIAGKPPEDQPESRFALLRQFGLRTAQT